ncbi:hypothetical protein IE53DRAFT_382060 [Violaceomyces palustris]|uniref:Uncharacterized protein n=1 Tax=Violaceomyces palustris TaxID=1673888 RepID=A0ACD0NNW4_9BASI|nr:hypothetical protein IE53DRAFT_382060 [Violaceomyces palustris]
MASLSAPPSQLPTSYRALVKIALTQRQTRIYLLSLVASHTLLSLTLFNPLALAWPTSFLSSLLSFSLAILPLIVSNKRSLTASPSSSTTPSPPSPVAGGGGGKVAVVKLAETRFERFQEVLTDADSWTSALAHSLSALVLALIHSFYLTSQLGTQDASDWSPRTWVASHSSHYANERFLYLLGSTSLLGAIYSLLFRSYLAAARSPYRPSFDPHSIHPGDPSNKLSSRVTRRLKSDLPRAVLFGYLGSLALFSLYLFLRRPIWRTVLAILGPRGIARRLLVPSFRTDLSKADLLLRSMMLGGAVTGSLESAHIIFQVYVTQPLVPLSRLAREPNSVLLNGLEDGNPFFRQHALSELARISQADPERRKNIFKDVHGGPRTAWKAISSVCLGLLQDEARFLEAFCAGGGGGGEGGGRISESSSSQKVEESTKVGGDEVGNRRRTNRGVVEQAEKGDSSVTTTTVWDRLAGKDKKEEGQKEEGSGSAAKTTPTATSLPLLASRSGEKGRGGDAKPGKSKDTTTVAVGLTKLVASWLFRLVGNVYENWLPEDAKHALCPPRTRRKIFGYSPKVQLESILLLPDHLGLRRSTKAELIWSLSILQNLVLHSLTEDEYGTVQTDVTKVLETSLHLLSSLKRLSESVGSKTLPSNEQVELEFQLAWSHSGLEIQNSAQHLLRSVSEAFSGFGIVELENLKPTGLRARIQSLLQD